MPEILAIGDLYAVVHPGRGTFQAIVLRDEGSHVILEIAPGSYAKGLPGHRAVGVGEHLSVLKCRCSFTRVDASVPAAQEVLP